MIKGKGSQWEIKILKKRRWRTEEEERKGALAACGFYYFIEQLSSCMGNLSFKKIYVISLMFHR